MAMAASPLPTAVSLRALSDHHVTICSAGFDSPALGCPSPIPCVPRFRISSSLAIPPLLSNDGKADKLAVRASAPALLPLQDSLKLDSHPQDSSPSDISRLDEGAKNAISLDDETEDAVSSVDRSEAAPALRSPSFSPRKQQQSHRKGNYVPSYVIPSHPPNVRAFAERIHNVVSLREGRKIQSDVKQAGLDQDAYLASLLILMFNRFDDLPSARAVFDALNYPNVVAWNCIMKAYIKFKHFKVALHLFRQMLQKGLRPSRVTFLTILGACLSPESLAEGKWIHAYIEKQRMRRDIAICNSLITMYSRCGDLKEAVSIFEHMQHRSVVSWNAVIAAHCKQGNKQKALDLFARMQQARMQPDEHTFVGMLSVFDCPGYLADGKEIHNCIIDHGFHKEVIVGNALINMYNKCGSPDDAHFVFEQMETRDVISWTAMIDACAEHGRGKEALKLFREMQDKGFKPNRVTFLSVLRACAALEDAQEGKAIHSLLNKHGIPIDVYLSNALIYMYGKGGALGEARTVFDQMHEHDTVSWTILLHAYASHKYSKEALNLFELMQERKVEHKKSHFISALDACGMISDLDKGKELHEQISKAGFLSDNKVGNALICMYGRCGALKDACAVFQSMRQHDVVSWNAMISMYANWDYSEDAFDCFAAMQESRVVPNKLTFFGLLCACTSANAMVEGKVFHRKILDFGFDKETLLCDALVTMYGKCGALDEAQAMFDLMRTPELTSWNVLIGAYCHARNGKGALNIFRRMQENGVKPDKVTFLNVLSACIIVGAQDFGETVHQLIKEFGWGSDVVIGGALINMYSKFRVLEAAKAVFEGMDGQNVISWTAMIDAYAKHGCHKEAVELFKRMQQSDLEPNKVTIVSVLGSCSQPAALEDGILIHTYIIDVGFESDLSIGNTLVGMYGKCQALDYACQAFHRTGQHDVVSWTALMNAYLRCQKHAEVLELFQKMQEEVQPNQVTFVCAIRACMMSKNLAEGKAVHAKILVSPYASDIVLKQALIDMYHSCGAFEDLYTLTS